MISSMTEMFFSCSAFLTVEISGVFVKKIATNETTTKYPKMYKNVFLLNSLRVMEKLKTTATKIKKMNVNIDRFAPLRKEIP
jgi:hypothetical protein